MLAHPHPSNTLYMQKWLATDERYQIRSEKIPCRKMRLHEPGMVTYRYKSTHETNTSTPSRFVRFRSWKQLPDKIFHFPSKINGSLNYRTYFIYNKCTNTLTSIHASMYLLIHQSFLLKNVKPHSCSCRIFLTIMDKCKEN